MDKNRISYNGYIIEANTHQLETKKWTLDITIYKNYGNKVVAKPFYSNNTFENKEDAINNCYIFGSNIIDGKITKCSLSENKSIW
ncbi:MAG: hypothetical protein A2452_08345 [Candidatus Firestonebacteria bacterium RIFOXYC2_FULL_39_67]|nr:MAG: hypothetical protein A2536_05330 [Candidatus Firestonebacteria bacterium RIFOXYD2_FULL_39_29]OGF56930.1 MAG: hypothetical protein A2452_08345 [Candidatus Firestonebacteria bacterium RIFOXYC2_FULL_39_67]